MVGSPLFAQMKTGSGMQTYNSVFGLSDPAKAERPQVTVAEVDPLPAADKLFTDPRWQQAGVTPLSLQAPSNVIFARPPESTQVRVLWDKEFLLMRFDCQDQSIVHLPGSDAAKAERDLPYFKADAVEVFLDPVGDSRTYMEFQFTPNNGVFDAIYFCAATPRSQPNFMLDNDLANDLFCIKEWNLAGLQTTAQVWPEAEGRGWSVIAAFPAKEILQRLGKTQFAAGMAMKINFVRFNYYSDGRTQREITNWAPVFAGCAHISPAGMGTLILGPHS
jgi:Carbohydrate family 9 binding domain-like